MGILIMGMDNKEQKTSLWQKIALVLFGLFLITAVIEICLRAGGFIAQSLQEHRNLQSIKQKGAFRIMCLGESTTALGGKNSYPSQLQELLNQSNLGIKFTVINRGIPGTNTTVIVSQLEDNLNKYNPDIVITMMGLNDIDSSLPYEEMVDPGPRVFFRSLKICKLAEFLWLRIIAKTKEASLNRQEYAKIDDSFKDVNSLNHEGDITYFRLGERYLEDGEFAQAEGMFKKAIALNPGNDEAYIRLGWLYRWQEKFAQAEGMFKKAIALNPDNDEAYVGLGWLSLWPEILSQEAEDMFKKAIAVSPGKYMGYIRLGWLYLWQEKFSQAEDMFKKAIASDPRKNMGYIELASIYQEQEKFAQAEELIKRGIELNPNDDKLYGAMAIISAEMRRNESFQEYLKKTYALRMESYNPITVSNYKKFKEILDSRKIKLVCVQYPMRNIEPLKRIFKGQEGVVFVDNEKIFKEATRNSGYKEYFIDIFGGDFGHCTPKGDRLLAQNVANVILRELFRE